MPHKPAYVAIAEIFRDKVARRELTSGDKLPSERELVVEFGVARMTVRHALDILQSEGIIERRRGRSGGTFVKTQPQLVNAAEIGGIYDEACTDRVGSHTHRILANTVIDAPERVCGIFNLEAVRHVRHVEVVHLLEGRPALHEMIFLSPTAKTPVWMGGGATEDGLEATHREDVIIPSLSIATESAVLGIPEHTAVVRINRKLFSGETCIAYSTITVNRDVVQLVVHGEAEEATASRGRNQDIIQAS
ncbi:GntR family transcriptional regulator [Corynebacterium aquatimens]|uniref:GntR family transcriptional regulator n=1 Tax=Corynebacterium aquatimens TaxID=1190508 RepID=A0A931GSM3_9CORY|nr:GntR family transcriptional regulator [Corynebacterium aquatimens]MBG6122202.1 GntR family transcriptional regulator [Corynebacterium aquatimens]WJY65257.1 Mannosyl-D-glycerate transport/metabolism system repressor MngR [Corynebacterium aquatimens]